MGRRQVVESANAALKGTFADLNRGFFSVFDKNQVDHAARLHDRRVQPRPDPELPGEAAGNG
jgi:hypothetical protein